LSNNQGNEVTANKTSGKAAIAENQNEIKIKAAGLTSDSIIQVTPLGSTNNQVLYVKSQVADNPATGENEGEFVVGFDQASPNYVQFSWWIIR
jgi:hypothetical protein